MGTMSVVYGTLDFETPDVLQRWLDRAFPRDAPEGPALFGEGGELFVEGTIGALLDSFRERSLPGEINEVGTEGSALVLDGVINEDDWLYWADLVHALAADAGARGASGMLSVHDLEGGSAATITLGAGGATYGDGPSDEDRFLALLARSEGA